MDWKNCKRILIIRPDNMGDLLMSSPAIRALKNSFHCHITLLTSSMSAEVAELILEIDEVIVFNLPWYKLAETSNSDNIFQLISLLKTLNFDGCILFNVFSQNPAPCLMLAYLAEIPLRAAYSRENLYGLLTHWLPDEEPYSFVQHQVERDLKLIEFIGGNILDRNMRIVIPDNHNSIFNSSFKKFNRKQYCVLHPGVSEDKRKFSLQGWVDLGKAIFKEYKLPLLFTGSIADHDLNSEICKEIGERTVNFAGKLSIIELAECLENAKFLVAVNTGPVHLAAAVNTPIVVLYARTNPQHHPWMVNYRAVEFDVPEDQRSKNPILQYIHHEFYASQIDYPTTEKIMTQLKELLH
ncbi:glycosyltransferase family 9 protein [Pedobacter mucosus]|uniref:glycosyltransferase family 9 protein n=1 Tax=Pedobacter mucosus TaxID=2895286 RepID=UPI001EE4812D|nr:glycosyltransferase family 9 protein [Pedobacter mucosus]UKT62595.1 glycosyltransferase family 9 protein [Pedobacter mucosus]